MKMGILGSGGIAHTMANTVKQMADVELYAVGARTLEKAQSFAEEFGMPKAYGSYEELAADPELDLVYVATPHSHHYPHVKLLLEHGKNVLCEKAFTVNADQARELFQMAEEKKLLLTEAIWTRYIPIQKTLRNVIESGAIGKSTFHDGQSLLSHQRCGASQKAGAGRWSSSGCGRLSSEFCLYDRPDASG